MERRRRDVNARTAAVVTVGTEIVSGLLVDTNTADIALALARSGIDVVEAVSVADDRAMLAATIRRLVREADIVIVTGGLGPTHDDVTRHAASEALGLPLVRDVGLEAGLVQWAARHTDARAAAQVFHQADVIEGARVLPAVKGTAPGLVVPTERGVLALLPGPPREMRPMLAGLSAEWGEDSAPPAIVRCAAMSESDAQVAAQDVLAERTDVALTVLAAPGDVQVVLFDRGIGAAGLRDLAVRVCERIGPSCYSTDGSTLAATVLRLARERGETIATAESCTGGLVAAALTDVAGASDVFAGSVVAYSNEAKVEVLDVPPGMLAQYGAVSEQVARAMAEGALTALGVTRAVAVTGIAGPGGGTDDKPVGTVWFATAGPGGSSATTRLFPGSRDIIRTRSAALALDLLRRSLAGL
jgi:nicotinamide-nucleotide amidase